MLYSGKSGAFSATRFEWTQFPGCGPAVEVFGSVSDRRILELGCGTGANAAILARNGAVVDGIDVAVVNIAEARVRYASQGGLTFAACSAESYLSTTKSTYECVYSVFGALSFADPSMLLPLVRRRLVSGGSLCFSVRHPEWNDSGPPSSQESRVVAHRLPTGTVVRRFELDRSTWSTALRRAGFTIDRMLDITPPPSRISARADHGPGPCCLLIACHRDQ